MEFFQVKRLHETSIAPKRGSTYAAGYDLCSSMDCSIPAWGKNLVSTGLSISIPDGYYARVASRSGLSVKNDIEVGAGVIDSDYRGELKVVLRNFSDNVFNVKAGDRVAQLIIEKIITPPVTEVDELTNTLRGIGGFGSTGISSNPSTNDDGFGGLDLSDKFPKYNPDGTLSQWADLYKRTGSQGQECLEQKDNQSTIGQHIDKIKSVNN